MKQIEAAFLKRDKRAWSSERSIRTSTPIEKATTLRKMNGHPRYNYPRRHGLVPSDLQYPSPSGQSRGVIPLPARYNEMSQGLDLIKAGILRTFLLKITQIIEHTVITTVTQCTVTGTYTVTIAVRAHRQPHVGVTVSKSSAVEGMLINYILCSIVQRRYHQIHSFFQRLPWSTPLSRPLIFAFKF